MIAPITGKKEMTGAANKPPIQHQHNNCVK